MHLENKNYKQHFSKMSKYRFFWFLVFGLKLWEEILKQQSDIEVVGPGVRNYSNAVRGLTWVPVVINYSFNILISSLGSSSLSPRSRFSTSSEALDSLPPCGSNASADRFRSAQS